MDKPKAIVNFINKCKDDGKRSSTIVPNYENRFKLSIYAKYEKYMYEENKVDFAELILLTTGLKNFNFSFFDFIKFSFLKFFL